MDLVIGNFSGGLNYYSHYKTPEVISSVPEMRKENDYFLQVYPNPADGYVKVELSSFSTSENLSIQIINLLGNVLFEQVFQQYITVKTESFQPGVYIIRIGELSYKLFISR